MRLSGSHRCRTTRTTRNRPVSTRSLSITAQCWRTRMTRRSVGSRYSSISRGASTLDQVGDEGADGLSAGAQRRPDVLDGVGGRTRPGPDDEDEKYDQEWPHDLLHADSYRRSDSM